MYEKPPNSRTQLVRNKKGVDHIGYIFYTLLTL